MKDIHLFESVGEVDDDLLSDAEEFLQRERVVKPRPWVKWGAAAACFVAVLCALWALPRRTADFPVIAPPPQTEPVQEDATPPAEVSQSTPNVDGPAADPERLESPATVLYFNDIAKAPAPATTAMFALMWEDFVPMTREELLDYFGVTLPIEEFIPVLNALPMDEEGGFGRGVYRSEDRGVYFDTTTFAFEGTDGAMGVYVTLDKAFHLPTAPWELPGDRLEFTEINGWELALFRYPDEDGINCQYVEFCQNGVNYRVCGKDICEGEFVAILRSLLEERDDHAPGEARTVYGTVTACVSREVLTSREADGSVTTEVFWHGPLGITLDEGERYVSLRVDLPEGEGKAWHETFSLFDRVAVTFTGEPATVGEVWPQQLVSVEKAEG